MASEGKSRYAHPDEVYWPRDGYAKAEMFSYYEHIAPVMLRHPKDRLVVLKRFPDGIDGVKFFQKDVRGTVPSFVRRITILAETIKKNVHYVVCDNVETLLYLANLGKIFVDYLRVRETARELAGRCGLRGVVV